MAAEWGTRSERTADYSNNNNGLRSELVIDLKLEGSEGEPGSRPDPVDALGGLFESARLEELAYA